MTEKVREKVMLESLPVFSPTSTDVWGVCPILWRESYRMGWRPNAATKADVSRIAGIGFSAGMSQYNLGKTEDVVLGAAFDSVQQEIDHLLAAHIDCSAFADMGDLELSLGNVLKYAITHDPTPSNWLVIEVEKPHPLAGNARCDVVYQTPNGEKVVRDYKFKLAFDETRWLASTLWTYEHSEQVPHYLWMTEATRFLLTIYGASPKPRLIKEHPIEWTEDELERWEFTQRYKWRMMQEHIQYPHACWPASQHETKYGKCQLVEWCLVHKRDEAKRGLAGLVKIERLVAGGL